MSAYFKNKRKRATTFGRGYFSTYQSPNIVITPSTSSINPPPLKKIKDENCMDVLTENDNDCTESENNNSQNNKVENLNNLQLGYTPNTNNLKQSIKLETNNKYNGQTDLSIQNIKQNFTNNCNEQDNSKEIMKNKIKINVSNKKTEKKIFKEVMKSTDTDLTNKKKVDTEAKVDKCSNSKNEIKTYKRINITINAQCQKLHKEEKEDIDYDGNMSPQSIQNLDLSFLDDFDVDELVESLYSCKNNIENDIFNYKKLMESNHVTNETMDKNNSEEFPTHNKTEKNLQDYNKVPEISDKMNNVSKHKPCLWENGQQSQQVANHRSTSHLHINDKELKDIDHNKKMDEITLRSEIKNAINVTVYSQAEKDFEASTKKGTQVENYHNQNAIHYNLNENVSEPEINTHDIFEHVNNKQKILNYYFVTKSDNIFAQQLATCIYNKLNIDCTVTAVIHYGKFSKLFKCKDRSGNYYTVKVLEKCVRNNNTNKEELLNRLKRDIPEEKLSCVFLLHSFGLNGYRCLMTYYYNYNLEQYLQDNKKPLNIHQICALAKQLMKAVFVLKTKKIVHNDIKPTHILLNTNIDSLKLCGFDEAYYYPSLNRVSTTDGTIHYFSPEKILEYSNGYSVDIWSTALVMYKMATNTNLFLGKTSNDVLFEQMRLFGNFSEEMINGSPLKSDHFIGPYFIRNRTNDTVEKNINNLRGWDHIEILILSIQSIFKNRIEGQECSYLFKVLLLKNLLKEILILDPKKRKPIEYVLSNDFFH